MRSDPSLANFIWACGENVSFLRNRLPRRTKYPHAICRSPQAVRRRVAETHRESAAPRYGDATLCICPTVLVARAPMP